MRRAIRKFLGIKSPSEELMPRPAEWEAAGKEIQRAMDESSAARPTGFPEIDADSYPPAPDMQPPRKRTQEEITRRKVKRMNGRNQINDSYERLTATIANFTQTYIEIAGGLDLEEDLTVAQGLSDLVSKAEYVSDRIEEQFNRDLIIDQKEEAQL